MKKYIIGAILLLIVSTGCRKVEIGYLKSEHAEYIPNSLEVRSELDPDTDKIRIDNNAPWVTLKVQGILGTPPLIYSLLDVVASEGGDAEMFKKELQVLGSGIMQVPLRPQSPKGKYLISLKVANEGHSANLKDVYTFIIN